jgi:hypothetical protein
MRAISLGVIVAPACLVFLIMLPTIFLEATVPRFGPMRHAGDYLAATERCCNRPLGEEDICAVCGTKGRREAAQVVLAGAYARMQGSPLALLARLRPQERDRLEEIRREHPPVSDEEVAAARKRLGIGGRLGAEPSVLEAGHHGLRVVAIIVPLFSAAFALPALAASAVLRGPPLLLLSGIVVQTVRGRRAGRARCLLRSAVAWLSGLVLLALLLPPPLDTPWAGGPRAIGRAMARSLREVEGIEAFLYVLAALLVLGMAGALARPERSLPDRIAGTHLVSR